MSNRAVFLDRDGVLIHDVHYLSDLGQIRLYSDVPSSLIRLKAAGFLLIVVTNQSGIARGYFDEEFVGKCHVELNNIFLQQNIQLDAWYYCPHHPDGDKPYNQVCDCRKPAAGMIDKATKEFDIDCKKSFVIGDKISDVELAVNTNASGILLKTGHGIKHSKAVSVKYPKIPIFDTFSEAVDFIINN